MSNRSLTEQDWFEEEPKMIRKKFQIFWICKMEKDKKNRQISEEIGLFQGNLT
jgi:hypothetical protein